MNKRKAGLSARRRKTSCKEIKITPRMQIYQPSTPSETWSVRGIILAYLHPRNHINLDQKEKDHHPHAKGRTKVAIKTKMQRLHQQELSKLLRKVDCLTI